MKPNQLNGPSGMPLGVYPGVTLAQQVRRALLTGTDSLHHSPPLYDEASENPDDPWDIDPNCNIRSDRFHWAEELATRKALHDLEQARHAELAAAGVEPTPPDLTPPIEDPS